MWDRQAQVLTPVSGGDVKFNSLTAVFYEVDEDESKQALALARRVRAGGAAQRVGPAGGGGVSCPHVACTKSYSCTECCMCPLEGRHTSGCTGLARLQAQVLNSKEGWPPKSQPEVLNGRGS